VTNGPVVLTGTAGPCIARLDPKRIETGNVNKTRLEKLIMIYTTRTVGIMIASLAVLALAGCSDDDNPGGSSSPPTYTFETTWPGLNGTAAVCGAHGGYLVAGFGDGYGHIINVSPKGDTNWTANPAGSSIRHFFDIENVPGGGYIISGSGTGASIVRVTESGDSIWTRTFGGTAGSGTYSLAAVPGGYVMVGRTDGQLEDVCVIKVTAEGDSLWSSVVGWADIDVARGVSATNDGGFVVTGETVSIGAGEKDILLIKYSSDGDTAWTNTIGGSESEVGYDVVETHDSGFVVVGWCESSSGAATHIYVVRTDSAGDTLWTRTFGAVGLNYATSVALASDGGYLVTGQLTASSEQAFLMNIDDSGNLAWFESYGGNMVESGQSVIATPDGGCLLVGSSSSFGSNNIYVVKTDADGKVADSARLVP
jgi:hypothetical protein